MSDSTVPEVKVEEVKTINPDVVIEDRVPPEVQKVVETTKEDIEKIVKDVLKAAIKELLEELKKPAILSTIDKDGDGVIYATEVKEAVKEHAQKLGCGPTCTIS